MTKVNHPFIACSLGCASCRAIIASVSTMSLTVPRKQIYRIARERGAVRIASGDWFCGPKCRMNFRLTHNISEIEVPDVET